MINNGVLINNGVIDITTKKNVVSGNTVIQLGDGTVTMEIKAGMQMKDFVISLLENIINGCVVNIANYFDVSFEKKLGVEVWTKITIYQMASLYMRKKEQY